ncbi:MAG TPA: hypothetical protein VEB69_05720, partial [Acidimicrobiia bacterium]|nr:hypothetical protein [Acidimicrobiia bacterium]
VHLARHDRRAGSVAAWVVDGSSEWVVVVAGAVVVLGARMVLPAGSWPVPGVQAASASAAAAATPRSRRWWVIMVFLSRLTGRVAGHSSL